MNPFFGKAVATLLALLALLSVTASRASASLDYAEPMEAYEVKALTGTIAPSNGRETLEGATPQAWLDNDPSVLQIDGVVRAWSGGFKAISGTKLWVHGGGHRDSANNGIYEYDFSGDTRPTGFELISISDLSDVRYRDGPGGIQFHDYVDGKPLSTHTYDGLVYAHHNESLYRFGGAPYDETGGGSDTAWHFDLATNTWTRLADMPQVPSRLTFINTVYDPESGKIALTRGRSTTLFFRCDTNTWGGSVSSSAGDVFAPDRPGAWDSRRGRGLLLGVGDSILWRINFDAETATAEDIELTGATEIRDADAPSPMYDSALDVYWVFGGDETSPGWQHLYEIDAETFEVSKHELTGDTIQHGLQQGSYGRFVLMEEERVIGLVANVDVPTYIIRLPDVILPSAPTDLQIIE